VLDDHALASRLSYFLWSTMPDETLRAVADKGELRKAGVLFAQVERMLNDPRARAFTENFTGQWLSLRDIAANTPDKALYPEFDELLQWSSLRETHLFFEEMLKQNLSVKNFVDSDFSMLNGRLAKHYGIPDVHGVAFRKVALKPERATENCAGCHSRIDPPGFALENYDVIGGWRERYRFVATVPKDRVNNRVGPLGKYLAAWQYGLGHPVDAGDVLSDGRKFADIGEFKKLLLADPEPVVRRVTEKLVTYATGHPVAPGDRAAVGRILAEARESDFGLRKIVHSIVASELFQRK
jgi:hypothetical protein